MPKGLKGFQKGHKQSNSGKTHFKKGMKMRLGTTGEKHPRFKGGRKETCKRYYNSHREQFRLNVIKRRAMLKNAEGSYTIKEWETLLAQYNWTCPCCKKKEPEIKLTVDHIIPLSKGGSNNIENIQPLCGNCNSSKSAKIINKFDY